MRTTKEIIERVGDELSEDLLGTQRSDLVVCLSYGAARPFLLETAKEDEWAPESRAPADVRERMRAYMEFAWDKANNRRGLSAGRSLDHMCSWLWLMGYTKASQRVRKYDHYGKPHLRAICEHFGWPWENWDDGLWTNDELVDGLAPPITVEAMDATNDFEEQEAADTWADRAMRAIYDDPPTAPETIAGASARLRECAPELLEICLDFYSSMDGHLETSKRFASLLGWLETGNIADMDKRPGDE